MILCVMTSHFNICFYRGGKSGSSLVNLYMPGRYMGWGTWVGM